MWIILTAVILLGLVILASYAVYRLAFHREKCVPGDVFELPPGKQQAEFAGVMRRNILAVLEEPFEQVQITSWDGTVLCGRYYHRKDGAPLQLLFHGYRGNGIREFSGTFHMTKALDMNVLVVDMRAHGQSGGRCITLGTWESEDCLCWAEYAYQRFGKNTPVVLYGASMGATTVLLASALRLPENVKCIVADSPFSSTKGIIRKVCMIGKLPFWLGYPLAVLGAGLFGHFTLWKGSALCAVSFGNMPILFIHGQADRFVPHEMGQALYKACKGTKRFYSVPGAGHCLSYYVDPEGYCRQLKIFFQECGVLAKTEI